MKKRINQLKYLSIGLMLCFIVAQGCSSKKECSKCNGSGSVTCSTCNGSGSLVGGFAKCMTCAGTGKRKCAVCDGTGKVDK